MYRLQTRTEKSPLKDEGAPPGSSSLSLLATYSGSSDSSDDEGLRRSSNSQKDTLPIPSAIRDMFETGLGISSEKHDHHEEEGVGSFWDSPDGSGRSLGYFEAGDGDSSSSGEDSRGEHDNGLLQSDAERGGEVAKRDLGDPELCLTSYTCWKCNHVGHLPQDCTVRVSTGARGQGRGGGAKAKVPKTLQLLYADCREIRSKKGQWCADCGVHSNLACCLDCR